MLAQRVPGKWFTYPWPGIGGEYVDPIEIPIRAPRTAYYNIDWEHREVVISDKGTCDCCPPDEETKAAESGANKPGGGTEPPDEWIPPGRDRGWIRLGDGERIPPSR